MEDYELAYQLIDGIMTTSTIVCDMCKEEESMDGDASDVAEMLYGDGWRGRTKIYCPKCAKKYLKKGAK